MTKPIEQIARAIQSELRRQGVLYEYEEGCEDLSTLMMNTGEAADLTALCRAILDVVVKPDNENDPPQLNETGQ